MSKPISFVQLQKKPFFFWRTSLPAAFKPKQLNVLEIVVFASKACLKLACHDISLCFLFERARADEITSTELFAPIN